MLLGTVAGFATGVLGSGPLSKMVSDDVSVLAAVLGMVLGWTVSWRFARRIPLVAD